MQTINSGNRNYYDSLQFGGNRHYFFTSIFLAWELLFITWGKEAFCWGIIIKVIIGVRGTFSDKGSLPGGGSLINLMKVVQSSNN